MHFGWCYNLFETFREFFKATFKFSMHAFICVLGRSRTLVPAKKIVIRYLDILHVQETFGAETSKNKLTNGTVGSFVQQDW